MKKNNYISLLLLFVFSLLLVHNIIPHHHFDEISEINNHSLSAFGTEHKNHHHHDKKEQNHHNENDEPIGLFSHPTHILVSTEFVFSWDNPFQKIQNDNPYFLNSDLVIKTKTIPIKRKPPNFVSAIPLQLFGPTLSLRGPPTFSV